MNENIAYQRLGTRTFWVFVLQNSGPALILLIVWLALVITKFIGIENLLPFLADYQNGFTLANDVLVVGIAGGIGLILLLEAFAVLMASLTHYSYKFALGENALLIVKGILSKSETSIPYRQIQDVDLEQNLTDRILGVARLAILTAGHDDNSSDTRDDRSEGTLPVMGRAEAEEMRKELLDRSNVQKVTYAPAPAPIPSPSA
jgi:uncharacterized membrane protein YdbT with pleckstrin-like domain